jgi:hypothetical protein
VDTSVVEAVTEAVRRRPWASAQCHKFKENLLEAFQDRNNMEYATISMFMYHRYTKESR